MTTFDVSKIINAISETPNCIVYPAENMPIIQSMHSLPEDLKEFYEICGGVNLFIDSAFPTLVVPPSRFVQANPIIFSKIGPEQLADIKDDISWSWYLLGTGPNSQYITIDLDTARLGNCYDSFWDRHPRDSYIIAYSFTDLITRLLENKGEYYYWDSPDFVSLGSPYENGQ